MKKLGPLVLVLLMCGLLGCNQSKTPVLNKASFNAINEEAQIENMLDSLNLAAAQPNFDTYFSFYADSAIFTGTDATERWDKKRFMEWAKPIFEKGKAWNFTSIERHIYFDKSGDIAWFDELLNTQMKICRGSGVVIKEGNSWKIKQYILSATVPNAIIDDVVKMKTKEEDIILNSLIKN